MPPTPTAPVKVYRVSFGVQYGADENHTVHPTWPPADGDGYVEVFAPDEEAARKLAVFAFEHYWAFMYSPEEWAVKPAEQIARYWPKGCIGSLQLILTERNPE